MAKKKEKTFAERAKSIMNKYKNRLGENLDRDDPLAKAALQRELQELAMEQESVKASMQEESIANEMAMGGYLPALYDGTSTLQGPVYPVSQPSFGSRYGYGPYNTWGSNDPNMSGLIKEYRSNDAGPITPMHSIPYSDEVTLSNSTPVKLYNKRESDGNGIPWTTYAASGAQVLGDILSAAMLFDKKGDVSYEPPTNYPQFIPVSVTEQVLQARENAINARRGAMGYTGKYGAQAVGAVADAEFAKQLAQAYQWAEQQNALARNKFNQESFATNKAIADMRADVDLRNNANRMNNSAQVAQYLEKLGTDLAGFPQTVAQINRDNQTMPFLSQANWQIDKNGDRFHSPAPGFAYYPDTGEYEIDGKLVDGDYYRMLFSDYASKMKKEPTRTGKSKDK